MSKTMKQVINVPGPRAKADLTSGPVPEPSAKQVLIKVIVSGSNPKDWKAPELAANYKKDDDGSFMAVSKKGINQGDDIAGIVEAVGQDVLDFKKGDRVAAFHEMGAPGGSYAEYALAWHWTTFHLPETTSFEEGATIPLAALTAAVSMFRNLRLPTPWNPATAPTPFLVYGASSAVGSYAIKLARNSNIHPIIAVAGKGMQHVESMLDKTKGDVVLDYRSGSDKVVSQVREHLKSSDYGAVKHGLDPGIGEPAQNILREIVDSDGAINLVLPSSFDVAPIARTLTSVGIVHNQENGAYGADGSDLGLVTCRWFTRALQARTFNGHPFEVRAKGLEGVEQALQDLKDGKQSASKYVFRIAETPGIES